MEAVAGDRRYRAFISYSHHDRAWAQRLHRALEGYVVPGRLVGQKTTAGVVPRRIRPIFRDRDELAASADLRERIHRALAQASCLIVICSPHAAESRWVEDEIVRFKAIHGESRVFAIIVAGTPNASASQAGGALECFPRALRFHVDAAGRLTDKPAEIIAADARPRADGRRLATLKLIAGMLEVDLDALVQRDAHRQIMQMLMLSMVCIAVAASMSVLAIEAVRSRDEARAQRSHSESFIDFMIGDLNDKLQPSGHLDLLDAIAKKAIDYYNSQDNAHLSPAELGQRARTLHELGDISDRRGDLKRAQQYFDEASRLTGALVSKDPDNTSLLFDQAQSFYWAGYMAHRRGEEAKAETDFRQYQSVMAWLVGRDPANQGWRSELADAKLAIGTVLLGEGKSDEAARLLSEALEEYRRLQALKPDDRDRTEALVNGLAWLADAQAQRGDIDGALAHRIEEKAQCETSLEGRPDDNELATDLAVAQMAIAKLQLQQGKIGAARQELEASVALSNRLISEDPGNSSYKEHAAVAEMLLSEADLKDGLTGAARSTSTDSELIVRGLVNRDATVAYWKGALLGGARLARLRADAESALPNALHVQAALAPSVAEAARLSALLDADPANRALARVTAESSLLAGDAKYLSGDTGGARASWLRTREILARTQAGGGPVVPRDSLLLREASRRLDQGLSLARPAPYGRRQVVRETGSGDLPTGYAW